MSYNYLYVTFNHEDGWDVKFSKAASPHREYDSIYNKIHHASKPMAEEDLIAEAIEDKSYDELERLVLSLFLVKKELTGDSFTTMKKNFDERFISPQTLANVPNSVFDLARTLGV